METHRKIIIDTDIGDDIDDAFAILLAMMSERFEILGITTVFRNSLQRGKIARALVESAGKNIPVYIGADMPLGGQMPFFPFEKRDKTGKPGIPHYFPEMEGKRTEEKSAEDFILDSAERFSGEVSIIALAPFTNLANARAKSPERFQKLRQILLMGGDVSFNFAEWNVRCDYVSAKSVFDCGVDSVVCGLDITSAAVLSEQDLARLRMLRSAPFRLLMKMTDKYIRDYCGMRRPTMHDPLALCTYLLPEKFEFENRRLSVSTEEFTKGKLREAGLEKKVVVKADVRAVIEYMIDTFSRYDEYLMEKSQ